MHPLDGSRLKIDRAQHHLDSLERSVSSFLNSEPYVVSRQDDDIGVTYQVQLRRALPFEWGLMVGDVVSNLRSSLDYIVFQLSLPRLQRGTDPRDWQVPQFPICDKRTAYCGRGSKRLIRFVPRGCHRTIEQLQPYHRKHWPELDLLSILRDISNADKHRLVVPTFSEVELGFESKRTFPQHRFRLDIQDQGFLTVIPEKVIPLLGDKLKPNLAAQVILDVPRMRNQRMDTEPFSVKVLWDIHKFVRDQVLPRFVSCFPR